MPRTVICTIGEAWPMGQVLRGPVHFTNPIPFYGAWADRHGEVPIAQVELKQEGNEFVIYDDLMYCQETQFISCGIKTELNEGLEMVDCTMVALFIASKGI